MFLYITPNHLSNKLSEFNQSTSINYLIDPLKQSTLKTNAKELNKNKLIKFASITNNQLLDLFIGKLLMSLSQNDVDLHITQYNIIVMYNKAFESVEKLIQKYNTLMLNTKVKVLIVKQ